MLAVITCHFNPQHYKRLVKNYWRFRDNLHQELTTIELSYDGEYSIPEAIHIKGDYITQNLWQKEQLLNLAAEQLDDKYDKIAWLDGDILFENKNWFEETEAALDKHDVVQLFEHVHLCDANGEIEKSIDSVVAVDQRLPKNASPGFAWAAKRHIFPLMSHHILGGADQMLHFAWRGLFNTFMLAQMSKTWRLHYLNEAAQAYVKTNGVGFINGDIKHMFHGTHKNRQYLLRWNILSENDFDPTQDIRIAKNGLWEWASNKPDMHKRVADYFASRKEDE